MQKSSSEAGAALAERRAVSWIIILYIAFFALWCVGLIIGLSDSTRMVLGMPLWFFVSCVASYVIICVALVQVVRRRFK